MVQRLFVVTKDRRVVFGQNLHGPAIATQFGVNINGNTVDDLGVLVASVREAIQDEGDLFQGSRDAKGAMLLRTLRSCFLGGLEATLQEWRTGGIGHIAIWAHGSTHFLPWHLLLDDETPLADSFIVTGLPSVTLLRPRPDPASRPRSGLFAFGRTFEDNNESGLPTLPSVSQELKSVGQVRGAKVYVNETATKAALAVAFREARWIHIATHGAQNPRAPSFHKILLSPGQDDDGVLYAYEVLSSDLRGLDLITLSACETALGRVDRSDNLRGLSAAFFQAGVATIVGTLWAVSDEAAALFFGRLYRQLELGESKLASFSIAQRETRLVFPEFRDWGAFQYLGRW
jgi:CHAT domain-containing protein